ncbi:uncharacterized protein LOC62_01G000183 [Vanrija pseudolonga]|uniref:Uncharacterized protein n=1 Tax=Vanrija pseudolonga TaxID=143232 RepID=A0AAF1BEJ7_9TREE|nr:hypothetical protein LOC62_01G000183 [Vanrija pseudolonga]
MSKSLQQHFIEIGTAVAELGAKVTAFSKHPTLKPALDIITGGPVHMPADAPEWAQQAGMGVNHLLREVAELRAELRAAQLQNEYINACCIARALNSRSRGAMEDELEPLPTLPVMTAAPAPLPALGDAPASFPATVGALRDLEGSAELDALLVAYGLEAGGTAKERRDRFAKHIGCVL